MLNIAHRGHTREWPGNTLEAIEAAIRLGVDAVEVDVRETEDGGFVLAHDGILQGKKIGGMPLGEVVALDAGMGCRVATLEEALDLCRGQIGVVVELKEVRSVRALLDVVVGSGEEGKVGLCSFDPRVLRSVGEAGTGLRTGLIVDAPPEDTIAVLNELRCEVLGVRAPHITRGLVSGVQALGRMVFGWGVKDAADAGRLVGLGVDGLVSDFPDVVKGVLGRG